MGEHDSEGAASALVVGLAVLGLAGLACRDEGHESEEGEGRGEGTGEGPPGHGCLLAAGSGEGGLQGPGGLDWSPGTAPG